MTEKERIDAFLSTFKELEKCLVSLLPAGEEFTSFSRALNQVYSRHINPLISQRSNYEFLKTAGDIRNILSHEVNAAIPSEEFLSRFLLLSESILSPLSCYSICTKNILSCTVYDKVLFLLRRMEEESLSHVPILNKDESISGVFSRSTFFDLLKEEGKIRLTEDLTLQALSQYTDLDRHSNESFLFVSRNQRANDAFDLLLKKKAHDKAVSLLFVTEHGRKDEKLLGIITLTDCAKLAKDDRI